MAERGERTYSMWALLALFAVIGIVGLLAVLMAGSPRGATEQVGDQTLNSRLRASTTTTVAADATASTGPTDAAPAETAATPPPTPDTTLPPGVTGVLRDEGSTVLSLDVPPELGSTATTPVIPPVQIRRAEDGTSITIVISCARSSAEVPAQVSVTETDDSITVVAVTLVPEGGPPCDPAAPPREVPVTLERPIDGRPVVVVPAGTTVPSAPTS